MKFYPLRLLFCFLGLFIAQPSMAQTLELRRKEDPIPASLETMYKRGLEYLAKNQNERGFWETGVGEEPGVVGLCLIAFLAYGDDPNHGDYAENITRCLDYIFTNQRSSNGYIGNSMYNHGFATLALAEAYGAVDNKKIAPALEKAVNLILSSQKTNPSGAWRYTPNSNDADTTVTGCQMVALLGARNAGMGIPDKAIESGLTYLARCRGGDGSYGYTTAGNGRPTLTAIGVTTLALAKQKKGKGFAKSVEYLKNKLDYRDRRYPYYYEYYMAQALFHADSEAWEEWNLKNQRYLATLQRSNGAWPGSNGEAFNTAGALLSLALNFRYLPIYEK